MKITTERESPRLLVVDDEPELCALVARVAERAGFAVQTTNDPSRLAELYDGGLAAIVLDLAMPGVDGVELLRELAWCGCRASIILMSGFDAKVLETAGRLGAGLGLHIAGQLAKPIRAADLIDLLSRQAPSAPAPTVRRDSADVSAGELRWAIEHGQLVVHYQPQAAFDDGRIAGVEALVRWRHPTLGLLYPGAFIPLAERAGLGLVLTEAVLDQALAQCAACAGHGRRLPTLSVNLPPQALTDVSFPERVMTRLAHYRLPPEHLAFEITETSVARDPLAALDILTRLRIKGIRLSIDDFGTGHSSLEQLQRLPFSELKIDMAFVRHLDTDAASRAIALAHDLGLTALAEGVENAPVWALFKDLGCDLVQGYFIAKPMPAEALMRWLPTWQAPPFFSQPPLVP